MKNNELDNKILELYNGVYKNPLIKSLTQSLNLCPIPIGTLIDNCVEHYISKIKSHRLHSFFTELDSGSIILTEEMIHTDDFLHAYFSTLDYVVRTRSDEKLKGFARILQELATQNISINTFEDYVSIFNELSEREFAMLSIKYQYEQKYPTEPYTNKYWEEFKSEVLNKINITEDEFEPLLVRTQRTGCYRKLTGFLDGGPNIYGHTTELFNIIYNIVTKENQ